MSPETKPRARRRRTTPKPPGEQEPEVSASEAREITKPEETPEAVEYLDVPLSEEQKALPTEIQLPAVTHSNVDPGTTALALLSDDEFAQRLETLKKGRERIAILQRELLIPSSDDKADGDYGRIPGTEKPTLFKSGAEKLCQFYGFVARIEVTFRAGDNATTPPLIYDANCFLHLGSTDGPIVATGYGTANSWEKRYLRGGNLKCPNCEKSNIRKSKQDPEWYCWRKTGGCGQTFRLDDQRITSQSVDPKGDAVGAYDLGVTLAKMAEKRAHVDATLRATATSGLFTQDIVEDENNDTRLDQEATVTAGGAILDASTGEVTGRVDDGGYGGDPEGPEPREPLHPAMGPDSATAERIASTQASVDEQVRVAQEAGPVVPQGDEVEQVLRRPDPKAEAEPEFTPSDVSDVGRGGVTKGSTGAQLAEVMRRSKSARLGPHGLITFMAQHGALDQKVADAMLQITDKAAAASALTSRLEKLDGQQMGKLVHDMREAFGDER